MTIRLIWAQGRNGVIGNENRLPWRIAEDSTRFRALTTGAAVVMGRKTWDSLPPVYRPLPGRENWVLTRDAEWAGDGAIRASSLDHVRENHRGDNLWVAGGGEVYSLALPIADECFVTEIDAEFGGDAWAPQLGAEWRPVEHHPEASDWQVPAKEGPRFRYKVFSRSAHTE